MAFGCALLGLALATQAPCPTPVIFGGTPASEYAAISRYVVYLDNDEFACTGTLIAQRVVLTAGHCVRDDFSDMEVHFLVADPDRFGVRYTTVDEIWRPTASTPDPSDPPPCLRTTCATDIALLHLAEAAPAGTRTMLLPDTNYARTAVPRLMVAGYGIEADRRKGGEDGDTVLRLAILERIEPPFRASGMLFTRQDNGVGVCRGDSGGPAFVPGEDGLIVLGVLSQTIEQSHERNTCAGLSASTSVYFWLDRMRPVLARWEAASASNPL